MKKAGIFLGLVSLILLSTASLWPDEDPAVSSLKSIHEQWRSAYPEERIYVQTDKPFYKPGETIWFSAFIRNGKNLSEESLSSRATIRLRNASGGVLSTKEYRLVNGIAAGDFSIPSSTPGGAYEIVVETPISSSVWNDAVYSKPITVFSQSLPELLLTARFTDKGYRPGSEVVMNISARTADDRFIVGGECKYLIREKEKTLTENKVITTDSGKAQIRFVLPETVSSNDVVVELALEHEGKKEALTRIVPVNLNEVQLQFFPESGELVEGQTSSLAFLSADENGNPIQVSARILDGKGRTVEYLNTFHHGMGSAEFTPVKNEKYSVIVDRPLCKKSFELPEIQKTGTIIRTEKGGEKKLRIRLLDDSQKELLMICQVRGNIIHSSRERLNENGEAIIDLNLEGVPMGVAQITAFSTDKKPLAERLCFVNRQESMNIELIPEKEKYLPREKVKLKIRASDKNGKPHSGILALGISDDKIHSYADDRSGTILTELLLEADVQGILDEPDFYLDLNEPRSEKALDLVMQTRGYRRFEWKKALSERIPSRPLGKEEHIVAGTVYDFENQKPKSGAVIVVKETGKKYHCGVDGKFVIDDLDLSSPKTLYVKQRKKSMSYVVNHYASDLRFDFNMKNGYSDYSTVQASGSSVKGRVMDLETGEYLPFVTIVIKQGDKTIVGATSDIDGFFQLPVVESGIYTIRASYVAYSQHEVRDVPLDKNSTLMMNIRMKAENVYLEEVQITSVNNRKNRNENKKNQTSIREETGSIELSEVMVVDYAVPLIDKDGSTSATINRQDIQKMPMRTTHSVSSLVTAYVSDAVDPDQNGMINIRGSREDVNIYFIDGVKVEQSQNIPLSGIEAITVYTGGIPANYGDVTGGVISIETRRYSPVYRPYGYQDDSHQTIYQAAGMSFVAERVFPSIIHKNSKQYEDMVDDRSTLFWNGRVALDEKGEGEVEFYPGDEVSTFRAIAEGVFANGQAGRGTSTIVIQPEIELTLNLPTTIVRGDLIRTNIIIINAGKNNLHGDFRIEGSLGWIHRFTGDSINLVVPSGQSRSFPIEIIYRGEEETAYLSVTFGKQKDNLQLQSRCTIVPNGFPVAKSWSGTENEKSFEFQLNETELNSASFGLTIFPTALASLHQGIASMIREPHGCFEQVSSSTYPNLLALQFLRNNHSVNEEAEKRAMEYVNDGYYRLVKYETPENGFSLYGRSPGSVFLSAYGLMEFTEMKKVFGGVDPSMLIRTKNYLYSKRDGMGGFFGKNDHASHVQSAFVVWAMTSAGETNLSPEIKIQSEYALKTKDPYMCGIMADVLFKTGLNNQAHELLRCVLDKQDKEGKWTSTSTVTYSYGDGIAIETSAILLQAMLNNAEAYTDPIRRCFDYLMTKRNPYGGWGPTQSTIQALRAIIRYYEVYQEPTAPAEIQLVINDHPITVKNIQPTYSGNIEIEKLEKHLRPGNNKIRMKTNSTKNGIPYSFYCRYHCPDPPKDENVWFTYNIRMSSEKINAGRSTRMLVEMKNTGKVTIRNPLAEIAFPASFRYDPGQFRLMAEQRIFEYYEFINNKLYLYLDELKPGEIKMIPIDIVATFSGEYQTPASRFYPYYSGIVAWSPSAKIKVE